MVLHSSNSMNHDDLDDPIPLKLDLASYKEDMSIIRDAVESNLKLATAQLASAGSPQEQTALTTHIILTRSLLNVLDNPPEVESWADVQRIHKMARETLNMDGNRNSKDIDWASMKTIKPAAKTVNAEVVEAPRPARIEPPKQPKTGLHEWPPLPDHVQPPPSKPKLTSSSEFRKPDGSFDRKAHMKWVQSMRHKR